MSGGDNEIDASLQDSSIRYQKCDAADAAAAGVMIPMCHPCFAGDKKGVNLPKLIWSSAVG